MDFLKKHAMFLIPAAITVAAVLLFVATSLMRAGINDEMQKRIGEGKTVKSLAGKAVSARQSEEEKQYQDAHEADAAAISALVVQSSQRQLLSYKVFPKPQGTSRQIFSMFAEAQKKAFEALLDDIGALDAPSNNEIDKVAGINSTNRVNIGSRTRRPNTSIRDEQSSREQITELVCKTRAEQIPVYASPSALSGYDFWEDYTVEDIEDATEKSWYCQLAYWIQKDIVDTIKKINADSTCVSDSPAKRLLAVSFTNAKAEGTKANTADGLPGYVAEKNKGLGAGWTGRKCDDDIDVVHFSLAVVVQTKDVLRFIDSLCSEKTHSFAGYDGAGSLQNFKHNQITVLEYEIRPLLKDSDEHERYRYGDEAVVKLNLVGEYIFNRVGYDKIKPDSIKNALGQLKEEKKDLKGSGRNRGAGSKNRAPSRSKQRNK